jgi:hypothetical protein
LRSGRSAAVRARPLIARSFRVADVPSPVEMSVARRIELAFSKCVVWIRGVRTTHDGQAMASQWASSTDRE